MLTADSLEIETVYATTLGRGVRIVGLCAAEPGLGVADVAEVLAERAARGGMATVLIDMACTPNPDGAPWIPGDGGARDSLQRDVRGFARLVCRPTFEAAFGFREPRLLRRLFDEDLAAYQVVLVEMPPFSEAEGAAVPTAIAAASCEATLIVCAPGETNETTLVSMVQALRVTETVIAGIILNERRDDSSGFEMPPPLVRLLQSRVGKALRAAVVAAAPRTAALVMRGLRAAGPVLARMPSAAATARRRLRATWERGVRKAKAAR